MRINVLLLAIAVSIASIASAQQNCPSGTCQLQTGSLVVLQQSCANGTCSLRDASPGMVTESRRPVRRPLLRLLQRRPVRSLLARLFRVRVRN